MTDSHDDTTRRPAVLDLMGGQKGVLLGAIPHARAIGMELVSVAPERAVLCLPYNHDLIGNPVTGVIHGGVVTTLLDTVSGLAVICALNALMPIATLDLRIDYTRAATPGETIYAQAECYHKTSAIAFVRASAYHQGEEEPIATSVATFMLETSHTLIPDTLAPDALAPDTHTPDARAPGRSKET